MTRIRTVVLLSGGLDSTVLAGHLLAAGDDVHAVSFDYGQRHRRRELDAARDVAGYYGLTHDVVDLTALGALLGGSALTDPTIDVPHGHYADDTMRITVVPNRNAIMLMAAAGIAAARGFQRVATAVHAGDHAIYPDCRAEFIVAASECAEQATAGHGDVKIVAPFVCHDKTWIVRRGAELHAPFYRTWSCYEGDPHQALGRPPTHCGACGTCHERREAFTRAGVYDTTSYYQLTPAGRVQS
jgi:7-cyano-7-deazaguanine synthase